MDFLPAFSENNIPVAMSSSNEYVPYLSVLIQSIIENSSEDHNYDIVILNRDISEQNQSILMHQCNKPNFSLRFYDMNEYVSGTKLYVKDLSIETYFRMFLTDIMKEYDKVLYLDVDIVTVCDVAELYNTDIGDNYAAAAIDVNIVGAYHSGNHWKPYIDEVLCLKDPESYVQAGVMILNLKEIRNSFSLKYIMELCAAREWRLFDQDILNYLCQGRMYILDMHYNTINGMEGRYENIMRWTPRSLREQWLEARKAPKVIHYVGKKKPWLSFVAEHEEYFWDYAKRSMYYHNLIVGRLLKVELLAVNKQLTALQNDVNSQKNLIKNLQMSGNKVSGKQPVAAGKQPAAAANGNIPKVALPSKKSRLKAVLIRCQSVYQLFNAVNLATTVLRNRTIDIMLSSATDFSEYVEPLKRSKLFRSVIMSDDTPDTYLDWRGKAKSVQNEISREPEKYICPFESRLDYSDLYIGVADDYNKIFYYYLLKQGCYTKIHFYEDGMNSYVMDKKATCAKDFIDHSLYGEYMFEKNIEDEYTYEPTIVINKNASTKYRRLSHIGYDSKVKKIFNNIFPHENLPKQKYIFLEEAFYCDGIASTDVELVEYMAEMVGKENIIVKLHPRNDYDRFTPRGFAVMQKSKSPWEMMLLNSDFSDKVFVTVSSTSAFTANLVFNKYFVSINLFKVMSLGKNIHVRDEKFLEFYKLLEAFFQDKATLFTPDSMDEFTEEIFYLEGGVN